MKILIFNSFGIGDVLFTTPLARNIKNNIPGTSLTLICNARVYPLLENSALFDDLMIFEKDEWRAAAEQSKLGFLRKAWDFRARIRNQEYDALFDFSLNSQYNFFLAATGIKKRIGPNFRNRGRFLTHKLDLPDGFTEKHVARHYLDLAKHLGINAQDLPFELTLTADDLNRARRILGAHKINERGILIGVCPGSGDSWGTTAYYKRWPEENYAALCRRLQKKYSATIILLGSSAEKSLCSQVADAMPQKPLDLSGIIGLKDFAAILSLCRLVITNDGGPFHIAQALGKDCVVFYGPVDDKVYGPYLPKGKCVSLTANVSCRPCYRRFRFPACVFDKRCLREISVDKAFEAASACLIDS